MDRKYRGQSIVEFALISVTLVTILAFTVDFARAFSAHITIGNMARAGAQVGTISEFLGADSKPAARSMIENGALAEADSIYGVTPSVDTRLCMDSAGYELVQVRVTYDFTPFMAIGPIGDTFELERHAEMRAQMFNPNAVEFNDSCF